MNKILRTNSSLSKSPSGKNITAGLSMVARNGAGEVTKTTSPRKK
jgi:hypothetical protein